MIPFKPGSLLQLCFLIYAILIYNVDATPQFHTVNDRFHNGTTCPAVTRENVACPLLCVTDLRLCPMGFGPSACPPGTSLCADGSCSTTCSSSLPSPCSCHAGGQYKACLNTPVKISIYNYKPANMTLQQYEACTKAMFKQDPSVPVVMDPSFLSTQADRIWNVCAAAKAINFPIKAPTVISYLSVYLAFFPLLGLWCLYKRWRERKLHKNGLQLLNGMEENPSATTAADADEKVLQREEVVVIRSKRLDSSSTDTSSSSSNSNGHERITIDHRDKHPMHQTEEEEDTIRQKGFKKDIFGTLMMGYMVIVSLLWLIVLLILTLDYYGYVTNGIPYGLFYESYDLSSKAFCVAWFLSTSWYLSLNVMRSKIKNFFRIETLFDQAQYIQIQKPRKVVKISSSTSSASSNIQENAEEDESFVEKAHYKHSKGRRTGDASNSVLDIVTKIENRFRRTLGLNVITKTIPISTSSMDGHRFFEFQSTRYHYNKQHGNFQPVALRDLFSTQPDHLLEMKHGLDSQTAERRLEALGPNFIEVTVPTFLQALWEELTGFFYLYQLQILWCYFYLAYWQIGLSDTCVILLAALIKVIVRIKSEKKIKSMAEHTSSCQVLRDGQWQENFSTTYLVPGDVFRIEPHHTVPVDAVILSGDIVVDESSLTGEPLPIRKFPLRHQQTQPQKKEESIPSTDQTITTKANHSPSSSTMPPQQAEFSTALFKSNSLYAGTTIKQSSKDAIALVLKTRTDTDKGQLIQRILFPQMVSFIFNEQLKVVFGILLLWAIVLLAFGSWWLGGTGMTAWFYGMTCAAQVMNPLLPAILVVGQSVAAGRLKKKGIYCVDFPRILMAGKVQVFCFDKTGTLTNEGLEYYGVHPCVEHVTGSNENDNRMLDDLYPRYEDLSGTESQRLLQMGLASCHSVTILDDEYIGNPVDIVMFKTTQAKLAQNKEGHDIINPSLLTPTLPTLEVLQQFEFQHARASMSVVVKDTTTGHVHVFCKGSFERIGEISQHLPSNFEEITTLSARQGCYVLGMAHRDLGILTKEEEEDLRINGSRDEMESNLEFLGLVLFKNLLKDDTAAAIQQLKEGDVRTVMITGDTVLTGVFIGQQCGLANPNVPIIVGDMVAASSNDEENVNYNDETKKSLTVQKSQHPKEKLVWYDSVSNKRIDHVDIALASGSELALTGKAFRYLTAQGIMRHYLFSTRIFARMTPIDKMQCVEMMMERAITAMCGDGGNDCGALKSAHVGIAMSEAEASVVSPFSTPNRSVQACVDLLIQGRSALATSFASYKYLIMYGETMACTKLITFYFTLSFSQWNFILVDAFITVFCSFAVTQAGAARKISPHRPTARILGSEVVLSVVGQLFINAWFLAGAFIWLYTKDDWFRCREWDSRATDASKWWLLGDSFEADILTFIVLFQFINAAMVFNYGYIFRQRWYRNYLLLLIWAVFVTIVSYWELADPNVFGCAVRLNCGNPDVLVQMGYPRPTWYIEPYNNPLGHNVLPKPFRYQLWGYSIGNMLAVHLWERFVVLGPVRQWLRRKYPLDRLQVAL